MEYGISILALVPLRKEPKDQSEMISQILFGQHFKILKILNNWVFIKLSSDNYEGWICSKQYFEITYEDYDNIEINDFAIVSDSFSNIIDMDTHESIPIPIGATLHFLSDENVICTVTSNTRVEFEGENHSLSSAGLIAKNRMGFNWKTFAGPLNWKYEGEILFDRRARLESNE